jgi:hypothetical protein
MDKNWKLDTMRSESGRWHSKIWNGYILKAAFYADTQEAAEAEARKYLAADKMEQVIRDLVRIHCCKLKEATEILAELEAKDES